MLDEEMWNPPSLETQLPDLRVALAQIQKQSQNLPRCETSERDPQRQCNGDKSAIEGGSTEG